MFVTAHECLTDRSGPFCQYDLGGHVAKARCMRQLAFIVDLMNVCLLRAKNDRSAVALDTRIV